MERTQTIPRREAPASVLTEPSYAAQILIITARLLGENVDDIGRWTLDERLTTATDAICGTLPEAVRTDATTRARNALPPLGRISCGQYAELLRRAAKGL